MKEYLKMTRSGTYGFIMAIPLFLGYEICMMITENQGVAISSAILFQKLLYMMGLSGPSLYIGLAVLLIVSGAVIIFNERKDNIKLKPKYFGLMMLESLIYLPVFIFVVGTLTKQITAKLSAMAPLADGSGGADIWSKIGLSLGAGVYEELVFRVILIGGIFVISNWVLVSLLDFEEKKGFFNSKVIAWFIAANIGSLIFSYVHYIGSLGDDFTVVSFIFRYIAGLVLFALYRLRGFGIAAWTHAIYDIAVLVFMTN